MVKTRCISFFYGCIFPHRSDESTKWLHIDKSNYACDKHRVMWYHWILSRIKRSQHHESIGDETNTKPMSWQNKRINVKNTQRKHNNVRFIYSFILLLLLFFSFHTSIHRGVAFMRLFYIVFHYVYSRWTLYMS